LPGISGGVRFQGIKFRNEFEGDLLGWQIRVDVNAGLQIFGG